MGSRPSGISGSRAADVLGVSDYATELEVFQRIMEERKPGWNAAHGFTPPEPVDNAAVRWGNAFEDAVFALALERRGVRIPLTTREQLWAIVDGKPYGYDLSGDGLSRDDVAITCHIDGQYTDGALHEGKTTTAWSFAELWGEPGSDRIPAGYQTQVQHQMLCTGAPVAVVSVLVFPRRPDEWEQAGLILKELPGRSDDLEWHMIVPRVRNGQTEARTVACSSWARVLDEMGWFHQYQIPARPSLQATMIERYREWWARYVLTETPPAATTYEDARRLFPAPKGTVVADEQMQRWLTEHAEIGSEIGSTGRLAKRRDELRVLVLDTARKLDAQLDDESREKTVFRDTEGKKLGQWNGKVFRT
jgi:predicted phage-related endonuclease